MKIRHWLTNIELTDTQLRRGVWSSIALCGVSVAMCLQSVLFGSDDYIVLNLVGIGMNIWCIRMNIQTLRRIGLPQQSIVTSAGDAFPFLRNSLLDVRWLHDNEQTIRNLLPETWTHASNFNVASFSEKLKAMGVAWDSPDDIRAMLFALEQMSIILRRDLMLKRNPHSVFRGFIQADKP